MYCVYTKGRAAREDAEDHTTIPYTFLQGFFPRSFAFPSRQTLSSGAVKLSRALFRPSVLALLEQESTRELFVHDYFRG